MTSENDEEAGGRGPSAITNAIAILRCFTVDEPSLGVTEIAARIGVHKSTVSRVLANLEAEDLVERDPVTRRFRLGLGIIAVAGPLLARLDVRRVAYPLLTELAERTRETAALMVWDGRGSVSVEQIPSSRQIKHTSALGTRYATVESASVLVFLAAMDDAAVRDLMRTGALGDTDATDDTDALLDRLADVRTEGYAVNYGRTSDDEVGLAAPVRDHRGEVVASVLISAPRYRTPRESIAGLGAACQDTADAISGRLGGLAHRPAER